MEEHYEEWFPLGKDLSFLNYVSMESIYGGVFRIFFIKDYYSTCNILGSEKKLVVEFEFHPISYRVGDESYRERTLSALPKNRNQSFFLSRQSFFLKDFYDDAGDIYKNIDFEHLLIVTQNNMFDFILDERPSVYTIDL